MAMSPLIEPPAESPCSNLQIDAHLALPRVMERR